MLMMPMFRISSVYSLLDFGHIGLVIMTIIIFLQRTCFSFVDEFCLVCMLCMLPFVCVMLCFLW